MKIVLHSLKHIFVCFMLLSVTVVFGKQVDVSTAKEIASNFLQTKTDHSISVENFSLVYQFESTVKGATAPCFYVFNAEPTGFVLVSADDCVKPILGYSTSGTFDTENVPENVAYFLNGYQQDIASLIENDVKPTENIKREWQNLMDGKIVAKNNRAIPQLLASTWNQDDPYNNLCPAASGGPNGHVYAGCVATAMAQIINYWKYPTTGYGSHSYIHATYEEQFADFGNTTYDYDMMPASISSGSPTPQIEAVSTLIYHCAVSVDMDFGINGSGAYSEDAAPALRLYFGYQDAYHFYREGYDDETWLDMLKTELENGRPMLYHGNDGSEGHAFVCDGYDESDYFHFNWGWSGMFDGYFSIDNLNPDGSNFSQNQGAIVNIEGQSSSNCETPTGLAITVGNDNTLYLTWAPPSSVENPRYKITIGSMIKYSYEPSYSILLPITGEICCTVATICDEIGEESAPTRPECVTLYPVNISENETEICKIYPNPANEKVIIEGENISRVMVYNVLGQIVDDIPVTENILHLNTVSYNTGVYVFRMITDKEEIISKRVVISR